MTRQEYRTWQAGTVDDLAPHVGIARACALVGRSRATHHRQAHPAPRVHGPWPKAHHPGELCEAERAGVLAVLNSAAYADISVAQVWARELDEGRYHCSQSTMYRILAEAGQNGERRRQATHPPKVVPELVAEAPNDVWSWDIHSHGSSAGRCTIKASIGSTLFLSRRMPRTVGRRHAKGCGQLPLSVGTRREGSCPSSDAEGRGPPRRPTKLPSVR